MARSLKNDPRARLRDLGEEALDIKIEHREVFRRLDEIAQEAKVLATELGESIKDTFVGKGVVKVSPQKERTLRGKLFKLATEVFLAKPASRRESLIASGIVTEEEDWSRADYGRFSADPF